MGRAGRPKLIQKEGHHFHDGYGRWHSIDQIHRPDLHLDIYKSIDNESIESVDSGEALDIYNLVLNLEKMEYGKALLFELQNTIQTLLRNKKLQNEIKVKQEVRYEQSALGGADAENREPNTYGLP